MAEGTAPGPDSDPDDATGGRSGVSAPDQPSPTAARVALGSGIALGMAMLAAMAIRRPEMLAINLEVYYHAADAALAGRDLYAVTPPDHPTYHYLYPPLVVLVFLPYALAGSWLVPFVVHTLAQIALGTALAWLLVGVIERHRGRLPPVDRGLVSGFVLASVHAVPTLYYGNVNLALAAALAFGFVALRRRPGLAGAALAIPAVLKVFPAGVGIWLLRRRAWRAIAGAVAVATATLLGGLALFGVPAHGRYLQVAVLDRLDPSLYAGGMSPNAQIVSLRRPVSVLVADDPLVVTLGSALAVTPVVATLLTRLDGPVARLVAIYAVLAGVVLALPSYFVYLAYLFFPLVPLLYLLEDPLARWLFAVGVALAGFAVPYDTVAEVTRTIAPGGVAETLLSVVRPMLTVGSPPLYGLMLTLAGCLVHWHRRETDEGRLAS